jgi:anti-anti-sigma regulatory factor
VRDSNRELPRSTSDRRRDAAPLTVSAHQGSGNVGVLCLKGYLNGPGGSVLVQEAHRLLERGCSLLLIDFAGTRLVNHHGLMALAELSGSFGTRLAFRNLSPTVARIFGIVGLTA